MEGSCTKNNMLQTDKELDFELDELIQIINPRSQPPITSSINTPQHASLLPSLHPRKEHANQKILRFKPWSGRHCSDDQDFQVIKEEISGLEDKEDEDGEAEGEKVGKDSFSEVSGGAAQDEIGYFYKFQAGGVRLIKRLLDQNGFKGSGSSKNWTIYWSSSVIKNDIYKALLPYQKANHFPNSFHLTRKDLMNKSISKMQIRHGQSHFSFLPKTYILPSEMTQLQQQMNKTPGITYIVKPHNRSQGKGITVTNQLTTVWNKLQKYSGLVVSHYISNPLLINGLKFDLRIYVAITGLNPLRIYVYQQGLARFATETYDQNGTDLENKRFQHLTNYSVNKRNSQFIKAERQNQDYFGSKWSLSALKDFLSYSVGREETVQLFARIDDLIVKTILSGENTLFTSFMNQLPYNNGCFEVLGFDVLIDSALKPWLVEVNMSPSMNTDSPLDLRIKGNLIADMLTLVGITPLSERYLDGSHLRYSINNFRKPDNKNIDLTPLQKFVIREVKAQNQRSSNWRRVFPCGDKRYKQFFEVDRYFNRLIREYENYEQGQQVRPLREMSKANYYSVQNKAAHEARRRTDTSTRMNYNSQSVAGRQPRKVNDISRDKVPKFSIRMNRARRTQL